MLKYYFLSALVFIIFTAQADEPFTFVDTQVMSMTGLNERDILQLTRQLTTPFEKPEEKVRAVFRWITANLEYDTDIVKGLHQRARTAQEVLTRKKDVCSGYAMLFKAMMDNLGIECAIINGHSKGYSYDIGHLFDERNSHAWNAVKINNQWYLIDATWGAGYIDGNRFVRSYNDYYFFTPPQELIHTHYPEERHWQLLDKKVTREEFENFVYLKPAYFKHHLQTSSHANYTIDADDAVQVKVWTPEDILVGASIYYGNNQLDQNFVFIQRNKDLWEINACFTDADSYILRLFAKRREKEGPYDWALEYRVKTRKSAEGAIGYPKQYMAFEQYKTYLYRPLTRFLPPGREATFRLRLQKAGKVALIHGETFEFFTEKQGLFEGKFIIPKGKFFIAASPPGSNQFSYLLEYEGWE